MNRDEFEAMLGHDIFDDGRYPTLDDYSRALAIIHQEEQQPRLTMVDCYVHVNVLGELVPPTIVRSEPEFDPERASRALAKAQRRRSEFHH